MLAQHFSIAGDDDRARRYFVRAADAAYDRYALAEAGDYYAQALALATAAPTAYAPDEVRHVAARYGLTLELRSRFDDALRHYAALVAVARQHADQGLELAMLLEQAKVYATANLSNDPANSRALLERAAPLAERLGDHAPQARLLWTLMLESVFRSGDPDERQAYGERALALARCVNLREQTAYILQDLPFVYGGRRHWDETRAVLVEARELWIELEHPVGLCEFSGRLSIVEMMTGDYERSLALTDEAYGIAERIHSPDMQALSHAFVGLIHTDRGDYARAIALGEAALVTGTLAGNVTAYSFAPRPTWGWPMPSWETTSAVSAWHRPRTMWLKPNSRFSSAGRARYWRGCTCGAAMRPRLPPCWAGWRRSRPTSASSASWCLFRRAPRWPRPSWLWRKARPPAPPRSWPSSPPH